MKTDAIYFSDFRIYLEDTDAGGIVYHANHLKFMERTRREWLRDLNIAHYLNQNYQFVVHSCQINYQKPLFMDDYIRTTIETCEIKAASMVLLQKIYVIDEVAKSPHIKHLASSATIKLACINQQLKPMALPKTFSHLLTS